MAKMKNLVPAEYAGYQAPTDPKHSTPLPAMPERAQDLLRELEQPCNEPVVLTDGSAPYVKFASSKSDDWNALRQLHPQVQEGTPYLVHADNQLELIDPLKFHLIGFRQCWTLRDDQYQLEDVKFSDQGRHSEFKEEFLAHLIIQVGERLIPAVSSFRGTKAGAVRASADALRKAGSTDWAQMSPAHAASAQFRLPLGRFVTTVTLEARTSRDKGRSYLLAIGHVRPTKLEELDKLTQALGDPDFVTQLQSTTDVFKSRVEDLESIARESDAA
jgi:hypothetical protein